MGYLGAKIKCLNIQKNATTQKKLSFYFFLQKNKLTKKSDRKRSLVCDKKCLIVEVVHQIRAIWSAL